ncbi:hypothetical protein GIB67_023336 [Kingdonia uniflora]|uniref:Fibronectin type-III domain-containing protein n=1 Tax=Kingdonia uniflora TaxID=39325 RepID=A0A7J7LI15_9MAGN|nr:hypothetical protein GIB67_023336 [Kingdonia uniflora]
MGAGAKRGQGGVACPIYRLGDEGGENIEREGFSGNVERKKRFQRSVMDSSLKGYPLDPSKCSKLTMEEKGDLLYQISEWSNDAAEMLQSLSRPELLQILRAEMGKDRKYTGMTKKKMIEHLLSVISEKNSGKQVLEADPEGKPTYPSNQTTVKRQRKTYTPSRLPIATNGDLNTKYCENSACRATLHREDTFCKRCSCCICYKYDDNKDPSLWLVCSSEPPYESDSCGMSYHLECALKDKRTGIAKETRHGGLDGSYNCVSCRKVNDLLGCWRKQLMTAKDTRRVDTLCYRVSLSQKLLLGTKKYQKLIEIVEIAAKKLETEVGPLAGLPVKMARGIVNRLSSGPEVQKLCVSAVESLDLMLSSSILNLPPNISTRAGVIKFENVCATSLVVVLHAEDEMPDKPVKYILWHRKAETKYPSEPTCILSTPNTSFLVAGLAPGTEYVFKVHSFCDTREMRTWEAKLSTKINLNKIAKSVAVEERDQSPTTNSSSLSNPSSEGDESNNISGYNGKIGKEGTPVESVSVLDEEHITVKEESERDSMKSTIGNLVVSDIVGPEKHSLEGQPVEELNIDNGLNHNEKKNEIVPFRHSGPDANPITPCKMEILRDKCSSYCKKRSEASCEVEHIKDGSTDGEYEHFVKMIRQLECEGHIEKSFRVKFLTWYSLRANSEDKRVVKVFVDTFANDPSCLAGQLVDTFMEKISRKRPPPGIPSGFCMKLWH